jgi:hypothetical protein
MRIPALISDLIRAAGLVDTRSDLAQPVFLTVNEKIVININIRAATEESGEALMLFSYLGALPETNRESALLSLLEADFSRNLTGGATLSVEPRSQAVVLIRELPAEGLMLAYVKSALEKFTQAALQWSDALAHLNENDSADGINFSKAEPIIDIDSLI